MEDFLGGGDFYFAINQYLNKYAFRNAETADLFNDLQELADTLDSISNDINVTDIMDTWTRQEGYPVINVEKQLNKFVLTQKRFLIDSDASFDLSKSSYK